MKRTRLLPAIAMAVALVASLMAALPAVALADTNEPVKIGGDASACPTTWYYTYVDDEGNPYFYYGNTKKTTKAVEAVCIDVSVWNGKVEWKKIKESGVEYAIIRCGYGQDITSQDDTQWARNVKYAQKYGIKIGVYLYSYANNEAKALGEAKHVLRCLNDVGLTPETVELPIYYDIEEASVRPSNQMLGRMMAVFANTISAEGYKVGVYSGAYWFLSYLTDPVFDTPGLSKWVANYAAQCTYCRTNGGKGNIVTMDKYSEYLDMWQFTSRGFAEGLSNGISRVDTNFMYTTDFQQLEEPVAIPGGAICYDLGGGKNNANNPSEYTSSDQVVKLSKPTRKYYTFKGWYANGVKVTQISASEYPAVTLVAKWQENTYKVIYNLNGGVNSDNNKSSYSCKDNPIELSKPTREGYTFKGWYTTASFDADSKVTEISGTKNQTVSLFAKWAPKKYKIAYVLTDGEMPATVVTKYTIETETFALPVPARGGYGFVGWCYKETLKGTRTMKINKGTIGNLTLYAKWKKGAYNATVTAKEVVTLAEPEEGTAAKKTVVKGDVVCISKTSDDGLWGKIYGTKNGWIKLTDIQAL